MKKSLFLFTILFWGILSINAQKMYTAKVAVSLKFQSKDGTNASAVTWNPIKKVYYSVIAGNASFPLESYNSAGEQINTEEAGIDARGLWYNSKTKQLEGNGQGETGIFSIKWNTSGKNKEVKILIEGKNQPANQCVGAFDSKKQIIYYYSNGKIYSYFRKNGKQKSSFNITNSQIDLENINSTTVIFTGIKNQELGLLDYYLHKVYLFDLKGKLTAIINLPENASTNNAFRFSFANNYIWLYDVDSRSWTGYSFN
jgi:hypothetical protein